MYILKSIYLLAGRKREAKKEGERTTITHLLEEPVKFSASLSLLPLPFLLWPWP